MKQAMNTKTMTFGSASADGDALAPNRASRPADEVEVSIPAEGLDVLDWNGPGYKKVHSFGEWRIAYLNSGPLFDEKNFSWIERHLKTEAFVLLEGEAVLVVGEGKHRITMERNKVYNVRKGVWHQILMRPMSKSLIVENLDTSKDNSEYIRW